MDKKNLPETNQHTIKGGGKGKEKETTTDNNGSISKSMAERLQASGRLALNAITSPSSQGLAAQASGDKAAAARSSSSAETRVGEGSSHRLQPVAGQQQGESLRSAQHVSDSSGQAFDEFLSGETVLPTEDLRSWSRDSTAVVEQELQDGAAVLDLLNSASFQPELDAFGQDDDANLDDGMTPQDADKLREALFGSTGNQFQPRWDDLLNFTPDFLNDTTGPSLDAQLHMGTSDPAEARSMWLRQWGDVLSAYTDQVWGDLGPLAAEARREVDELNAAAQNTQKPETKALERLRQILAHVRGH